jgi:hypothetical protein
VLLTRLPLTPKDAFDLHVLSLPPAFVLSQDQTLKLKSSISTVSTRIDRVFTRAGVSASQVRTLNNADLVEVFRSP